MSAMVLAVAPHPDDELLGAGGTLMGLRDAGADVVVLACSLGRPADHARRLAELEEACRRADFALRVLQPSAAISRDDDLRAAEQRIAAGVQDALAALRPALLIAPDASDAHHGHAVTARAVERGVQAAGTEQRVATWALWSTLAVTTTIVVLDEPILARVEHALQAHAGELRRAPHGDLVRSRARAAAILEPERALGFGTAHPGLAYAEALCERRYAPGDGWTIAPGRVVDAAELLHSRADPSGPDVRSGLPEQI